MWEPPISGKGGGLWVGTPTAGTGTKGRSKKWREGKTPNPQEFAVMWPSPRAQDGPHGPARDSLGDKVRWPTPARRDYRTGKRIHSKPKYYQLSDEVGHGGQLNPDWVEWLMNWPISWTSLKPIKEF